MNTLFIITVVCIVLELFFSFVQKVMVNIMDDLQKYRIAMDLDTFPTSYIIIGLLRILDRIVGVVCLAWGIILFLLK